MDKNNSKFDLDEFTHLVYVCLNTDMKDIYKLLFLISDFEMN